MRVASVQLEMADRPKAINVEHVLGVIDRMPAVDLILLPEIWPCGFFAFDRYAAESEPLDGPTVTAFRQQARARRCHNLMGSLVERGAGCLFNTTVFIGPDGEIIAMLPQDSPVRLPVRRNHASDPRQRDRRGRHPVGPGRILHLRL